MSGTQRLIDLFANLPDGEVYSEEGRIKAPSNHLVAPVEGPIANPRDWLERYLIPIIEQPPSVMAGARAKFASMQNGEGLHVDAAVWIGECDSARCCSNRRPDQVWESWAGASELRPAPSNR